MIKIISNILQEWKDVSEARKALEKKEEEIKNKVKIYLKERKWDKYNDESTGINVGLSIVKKEDIDREQLKVVLTERQYAQVIKVTSYEKLMITTPESRNKMRKFITNKKR